MIILGTCVLSAAFRKGSMDSNDSTVQTLKQMIIDDWPLAVPGIVYQEILTALRSEQQIARMVDLLEGFSVVLAKRDDHELGARIRSHCLKRGIASSSIDCLIAAITINRNGRLFTLDRDFSRIAQVCHLKIFEA